MNKPIKSPWLADIAAFLPIPLVYFGLCLIYIRLIVSYATSGIDPEFNYLFNGILLSHLKFHLNAIGHPGTPIQVLIAVVSRVIHLFRPGGTLWDDVILNPDIYIRSVLYTAAVINASVLFFTGRFMYRKTGSLIASLIIQLTPFAFVLTLEESNRMMPELIMPSIICLWIILLIKVLKNDDSRYPLLFGLLASFSLSDKLTFIPFVFLPMFLIQGAKSKLNYMGWLIVSFLVFAFPVMFNSHKFITWVTDLFTHKGVYGSGEKGIIDWNTFVNNLRFILGNTIQILIPVAFLIVLTVYMALSGKIKKRAIYLVAGLIFVFALQYAITAKHFAFYYLTPTLLMAVFAGYLVYELLKGTLRPAILKWLPEVLLLVFGIMLLVINVPKVVHQLNDMAERKSIKQEAFLKFEPILKNSPRIIAPDYFGCSSPEYALMFGLHESGRYNKIVLAEIEKHYPGTTFYLEWGDIYYKWNAEIAAEKVMERGRLYTLLIKGYTEDKLRKIVTSLSGDTTADVKVTMLAESKETNEAAFSIIKY
ncbi:MAG TPA: hypothetical protein VK179_06510 [Bacteroidales bacterium]|nr:hypothetical protein [Bacteroidales bacterium]